LNAYPLRRSPRDLASPGDDLRLDDELESVGQGDWSRELKQRAGVRQIANDALNDPARRRHGAALERPLPCRTAFVFHSASLMTARDFRPVKFELTHW